MMDRLGVSGGALDLVREAFATPEATRAATGLLGVLLAVACGVSFTTALQRAYLRAWRRAPGGGLRNKGRGAVWVGGVLVYLMALAFASNLTGTDIGAAGVWVAGVAAGSLLWWWTAWLMVRGEVRWRPLFPTAVFTAAGISLYAAFRPGVAGEATSPHRSPWPVRPRVPAIRRTPRPAAGSRDRRRCRPPAAPGFGITGHPAESRLTIDAANARASRWWADHKDRAERYRDPDAPGPTRRAPMSARRSPIRSFRWSAIPLRLVGQ